MIDSVVVKNSAGTATLVKGTDYLTGYDNNNNLLITIIDSSPAASYLVGYNKENPAAVTASKSRLALRLLTGMERGFSPICGATIGSF